MTGHLVGLPETNLLYQSGEIGFSIKLLTTSVRLSTRSGGLVAVSVSELQGNISILNGTEIGS